MSRRRSAGGMAGGARNAIVPCHLEGRACIPALIDEEAADWLRSACPEPVRWGNGRTPGGPSALPHRQVMVMERSKLTQPARAKASAMGTLPRSVEARLRGTSCAARIRVPSARISLMYPFPVGGHDAEVGDNGAVVVAAGITNPAGSPTGSVAICHHCRGSYSA